MAATTANAKGMTASELNASLGGAIAALTHFDAEKLEELEGRASAMLASGDFRTLFPAGDAERQADLDEIVAKHRLLGSLLASTSLNLNVLERLHSRNAVGEVSWVR